MNCNIPELMKFVVIVGSIIAVALAIIMAISKK